ncbi:hypothetical protein, partial [Dokdonella soli]|uniref:hypothetical protein n=1 Tax=Dokdonella soli TaxID=529810 RepID=UPI0031D95D5D
MNPAREPKPKDRPPLVTSAVVHPALEPGLPLRFLDAGAVDPRRTETAPPELRKNGRAAAGSPKLGKPIAISTHIDKAVEALRPRPTRSTFHVGELEALPAPHFAVFAAPHCHRAGSESPTIVRKSAEVKPKKQPASLERYWMIFATTPAPTVRPPSRIA